MRLVDSQIDKLQIQQQFPPNIKKPPWRGFHGVGKEGVIVTKIERKPKISMTIKVLLKMSTRMFLRMPTKMLMKISTKMLMKTLMRMSTKILMVMVMKMSRKQVRSWFLLKVKRYS